MWSILRTVNCWERYRQQTAQQLGCVGLPISWGAGPKEFPCLVCTYMPPVPAGAPPKLVSAYVYMSDAEALIAAGGLKVVRTVAEATPQAGETKCSQQDNFNRWVAVYLLALTRECREVGVLKPGPFEGSLNEALQLVDEAATEKRDALLAGLAPEEKAILDRLNPPR